MDIIIFSGQSNMQGQTESCPCEPAVKGAYEFRFFENKLIPLRHPVGENIGNIFLAAHEGHGSLIPDFCRAYIASTGKETMAVHIAKGGTTIAEWLPEHFSERYFMAVRKAKNARRKAGEIGKMYFVWLQGESDAIEGTSQIDYEKRMLKFRENLVKDLKIDGFFIIRMGKFVQDSRDIEILRAQENLCDGEKFVMLTRISGVLTQCPKYMNPYAAGHYNNAGMKLLGTAAGENLARIRLGRKIVLEEEPYKEMKR